MYCSAIKPIFQLFPRVTGLESISMLTSQAMAPGNTGFPVLDPSILKVSLLLSFQGHSVP